MDKLDYLPSEIIDCLTLEKTNPILNKKVVWLQNNKKKLRNSETHESKLPKYFDITSLRGEQIDKLNVVEIKSCIESIIPTKYCIKKEDLRRFIEYNDRELENIEESDKKLIVFPSPYPDGRHEVKCLERTLRLMLEDDSRPDLAFESLQIKSNDDIDVLSDYVVRQEKVYNVVLHELCRQMSTISVDTGSTVMELRNMYTDLVNKIPEELMRLKDEVKEQVVNDGKLLTQIEDFQAGIIYLTELLLIIVYAFVLRNYFIVRHLRTVKNHDIKVTKNAETLQKELESAMQDSARSKELLNEYHVLYDLQRQRLDQQMSSINIEKEEWSALTFALALKISDEALLTSLKRLRIITRKLIQLSQHFAIYISDCDTVITTRIQELSDKYLKMFTLLHNSTKNLVNKFYDLFHFLKNEFELFTKKKIIDPKNHLKEVLLKIKSLKSFLSHDDLKKFMTEIASENVRNYETDVDSMMSLIQELYALIDQLADRREFKIHPSSESVHVKGFTEMFENINQWNPIIASSINTISNFQHFFTDFQSKVTKIESEISILMATQDESISNHETMDFDNILLLIDELYIETFESKEFCKIQKNEDFSGFIQFSNGIEALMGNFRKEIDGFDANIIESINNHQASITRWLVNIIYLLSNMSEDNEIEIQYKNLCETFAHLITVNGSLYEYVTRYTEKFMDMAVSDQSSRQVEIEEYREENSQWSNVAEILIRNIGEKIEQELVKRKRESASIAQTINLDNIDELLDDIATKATDNNIYVSIKSVRNLKSELESTQKRIQEADVNKSNILLSLQETLEQVKEYENKIEELTNEYREFTK